MDSAISTACVLASSFIIILVNLQLILVIQSLRSACPKERNEEVEEWSICKNAIMALQAWALLAWVRPPSACWRIPF